MLHLVNTIKLNTTENLVGNKWSNILEHLVRKNKDLLTTLVSIKNIYWAYLISKTEKQNWKHQEENIFRETN